MKLPDGFRDILPLFSYIVNILTKVLEIFASYLGFDVNLPGEKDPASDENTQG